MFKFIIALFFFTGVVQAQPFVNAKMVRDKDSNYVVTIEAKGNRLDLMTPLRPDLVKRLGPNRYQLVFPGYHPMVPDLLWVLDGEVIKTNEILFIESEPEIGGPLEPSHPR